MGVEQQPAEPALSGPEAGSCDEWWAAKQAVRAEIAPPDRYNEWTQYWYTAEDLAANGYRKDTLAEVFGLPMPLPDGRLVWQASMVEKIEAEVLGPAAAVVVRAFSSWDNARDMGESRWWIHPDFQWPLTREGRDVVAERASRRGGGDVAAPGGSQ